MYRVLNIDSFNTRNAFYFIYDINQELRKAGVITHQDELLCNSFISETEKLYGNIMKEIIEFSSFQKYDIDFYKRLFEIEDRHLRVTHISPDDPFYPLFGLVKRCLEKVDGLLNLIMHEVRIDEMPKLTRDEVVFSILNNMKKFFDNLRLSSSNMYTLKQQGSNIGVKVGKKTRIKIHEIVHEQTRAYQMYLRTILDPISKRSPAYGSMANSYESLRIDFKLSGMEINNDSGTASIDQVQEFKPDLMNLHVNKGFVQDNSIPEIPLEQRIMLHDIQVPEDGVFTAYFSILDTKVSSPEAPFPQCVFLTALTTLAVVLFIFILTIKVF